MNKRSGHRRSMHKRSGHKRTERKGKKGTRGYRKGSKSKTMKGKKDFTTKKSSKVFNRRRHYQKHAKGSRVVRKPYAKKGGHAELKDAYKPSLHHDHSSGAQPTKTPLKTHVHHTNLAITPVKDYGDGYNLNNSGPGPTLEGLVKAINKTMPGYPGVNRDSLQQITLVKPTLQNDKGKGSLYRTGLFTQQQRGWLATGPTTGSVEEAATDIQNYFKKYTDPFSGNIKGTDIPNSLKYWESVLSPPSSSPSS